MSSQENRKEAGAISDVEAAVSGSFAGVLRRICGSDLLHIALLIGMAVAIASPMLLRSELVSDSDIWWHLADAWILTATHHFIRIEPYSFAVAGERWVDPEWLSELPYWGAYSAFGLRGIHLAALAGLCANLIFLYFRCVWKSHSRKASFWVAVLAFFLMTINSGARTIVVAYLAMSAEMAIIEAAERGAKRLLWLLPPLFCIWINLHGSWIMGLGFLVLYIGCGLVSVERGSFSQHAFSATDRHRLFGVLSASIAVLMLNPYGWRLIWNPFDMLMHQKLTISLMEEWKPLNLASSTGFASAVFIVLMIVANLVIGRKWKIYELVFILASWGYAFLHVRFVYLACIVTLPWLAADLARWYYGESSEETIPALNALFTLAIAASLVYFFPSEAAMQKNLAEDMPLQTIASIQPTWRTFSDYSLGGMLAYQSKPDFLDSRNDTFEHHGILQQFVAITNLQKPYQLLDRNRIDHVLTRDNAPLAFALKLSHSWQLARQEGTGENAYDLFVRVSGTGCAFKR